MLLNQVKKTIDRYHLLDEGDRLVIGVSAGVDSMVLLHVLNAFRQKFNLSFIIAHVNHGLRPKESENEAELVKEEAKRFGLIFEYGQFNAKEFQETEKISLQDAARRIRYHFFTTLFEKYHANKIALGHNADDQVETVLLRLMRGSGLEGLKGMLPIREGKVIRPLLEVWRREVEFFAKEMKIPYLMDSSNLKEDYLRNRLRLTLIPFIEKKFQPKFKGIVLKSSTILREENDYLEREAEQVFQSLIREEKDGFSFRFSQYQSLHPAIQWRVIQRVWKRMESGEMIIGDRGRVAVDQIYQKLNQRSPSFILELTPNIHLEKRYDLVSMRKRWMVPVLPFEIGLISPGRTYIEEIKREVVIEEIKRGEEDQKLHGHLNMAFLDYQTLQFPLRIRNFRPGDRFKPLGVKGTQKIKAFFIDHKIPKFERAQVPLLTSGEMIVWVVGYRIDERVKVTERTRSILKVEVI